MSAFLPILFGPAVAGGFGWVLYRGFKTGRMWLYYNDYAIRADQPILFWFSAAMNAAMILIGLVFVVLSLSRLPA